MAATTRERLVEAAFELFEEQGYDGTTVEEIAARAGTGRTTFFRAFGAKEDVVFPAHDAILERVDARLTAGTPATRDLTLREAARVVLEHYLAEGPVAQARYRLISAAPSLRDRESASVQRYLRLFSRHTRTWYAERPGGSLHADLLAAAVIAGHNHVLRDWLREQEPDPRGAFEAAMDVVLHRAERIGATVVVVPEGQPVDTTLAAVRAALTTDTS